MGVKVVIPTPLRQYTDKSPTVIVEGRTVEEVLRNLMQQYGDLQKHLYSDDGKLRSFVNIYRNDEDIRYLDREKTALKETDVVSIVPSIAGGSEQPEPRPQGRGLHRKRLRRECPVACAAGSDWMMREGRQQ
jgi:adenylyltransferase/sulfurtransferase